MFTQMHVYLFPQQIQFAFIQVQKIVMWFLFCHWQLQIHPLVALFTIRVDKHRPFKCSLLQPQQFASVVVCTRQMHPNHLIKFHIQYMCQNLLYFNIEQNPSVLREYCLKIHSPDQAVPSLLYLFICLPQRLFLYFCVRTSIDSALHIF